MTITVNGEDRSIETPTSVAELIEQFELTPRSVAVEVNEELVRRSCFAETVLRAGDRIEIRGFGSFALHYRPPRVGRNPKSGEPVSLPAKHVPHFKPGKQLRERVDNSFRSQSNP